MSLLGNILWLIFGGLFAGLGYIFGGILICLTIVGIPFGMQSIRLGIATFAPFGKSVVQTEKGDSNLYLLLDIIWILLAGWEIALIHLIHALVLALTVIGIPFAMQHIKLIPIAIFPFGKELK